MCGISVLFHKNLLTQQLLLDFLSSLNTINHRGPDDEGVVLINTTTGNYKIMRTEKTHKDVFGAHELADINLADYNLVLGHKRLSIIDLSFSGHQPMQGIDNSWIVFNGEIYNYIELKEELKILGAQFKTKSDTEVVLEAYRIWGIDCLTKFNGMWSICIWDAPNKRIVVNNDRFGVKPLYYYETNNSFRLVSETKQLSKYSDLTLLLNQTHVREFVKFGFLDMDENTMYESVLRFKKGHYIILSPLNYEHEYIYKNQKQYYYLHKRQDIINEKEAVEQFRNLLYNAIKIRMRADVGFGFALSGGLDSSAILYMAKNVIQNEKMTNELIGIGAVFPGFKDIDESPFIKIVTDDLPCKTYLSYAMEDFNASNFENHIYNQDEPLHGTSYFAQYNMYSTAKKNGVKILFNGQGADEVFAGYHHHFYRHCRNLLIRGKVIEYFSLIKLYANIKGIKSSKLHKIVANELKMSAQIKLGIIKFDHSILKYWNKINTLDEMLLRDFDTFQLPLYLRADDRDSMSFSIESRHPFMDYKLVEFGYSLPNNLLIKDGWQKYLIRKSMHELPKSIAYRTDKKGFITPQEVWINKYKDLFENYLTYNFEVLGNLKPSANDFYNYSLGAWFKVNSFSKANNSLN
jgi:asparagine synthase (glutamine-hydrolysing)